jgi:hypothetical protein
MKPDSPSTPVWTRARRFLYQIVKRLRGLCHSILHVGQTTDEGSPAAVNRDAEAINHKPKRIVRLLAVAMWPHGALTAELELGEHLDLQQLKKELKRLGWVYYFSENTPQTEVLQFNFSDSLKHGFVYSEASFNAAVNQVASKIAHRRR